MLPQHGVPHHRFLGGGRPLVQVDAEGCAYLHDFVLHRAHRTLEVDNKHGLFHGRARLRVHDALLNRAELGEGIAPGRTPHSAGEASLVDLRHDAGNVPEAPLRQRIIAEHRRREVAARGAGAARGTEDLQGGDDHLRFLHSLVPLGHQRHVVLLELEELLVQVLQLGLDRLQFVAVVDCQELLDLLRLDHAAVDLRDLVEHEAEDALALVQALRVLAVWPSHLAGVHVLKLDARILAKPVDVPARFLHWQN
mmetsp:Transcript_1373/g.3645  ORF Transcript_1373/g.3645 Transcript_1373/m.3645 type:complete len:252 (-) Transcript_1373:156-911(-)